MLERKRPQELVPSYSLTGDLLSYMRCGLQYRYQNGSALPPSRPVQMWFGEFIHGVMETAYRLWQRDRPQFPWPCNQTQFNENPPAGRIAHDIGQIGDLVEATLAAGGKSPRSRDLRNSAYRRATLAVNLIGPELFPLIRAAEEKVIGTRPLSVPPGLTPRARMYELHGVMDVLSSVDVLSISNPISRAVRAAVSEIPENAEIIVDYKGTHRPPLSSDYWAHGDWQLQMYAWLRSKQPNASRVVAGVLLYINELDPGQEAIKELQRAAKKKDTDVVPDDGSPDDYALRTWRPENAIPLFAEAFRMRRVVRVVPITPPSVNAALGKFDGVVASIEGCVASEAASGTIVDQWPTDGADEATCVACDFRHFCPRPATERNNPRYLPLAPRAPG
jgi:hypothetical protein